MSSKCSRCGEYDFFGNHKCPPRWLCIHAEDYGNNIFPPVDFMDEEGTEIYAPDAAKAAIKFAEKYQAKSTWYPAEMTVMVMDSNYDMIYKYDVLQEAVPSYWIDALYEPEIYQLEVGKKLRGRLA